MFTTGTPKTAKPIITITTLPSHKPILTIHSVFPKASPLRELAPTVANAAYGTTKPMKVIVTRVAPTIDLNTGVKMLNNTTL